MIGVLNLCSDAINSYTTDKLLGTVLHEMVHSLVSHTHLAVHTLACSAYIIHMAMHVPQGFTSSLFDFFIDPASGAELGASSVATSVPSVPATPGQPQQRGGYTMITTPKV